MTQPTQTLSHVWQEMKFTPVHVLIVDDADPIVVKDEEDDEGAVVCTCCGVGISDPRARQECAGEMLDE